MLSTISSWYAIAGNSFGDPPAALEKEAVGELHDVRLVHGRHLAAAGARRVLEREARDPAAGALGRHLDALDDAGNDLVLEARVLALGVLADDDQVEAGIARRMAGKVADRPDVGEEIELLPEGDVGVLEAVGGVETGLERDAVAADRRQRVGRQRRARARERGGAGVDALPRERRAGGVDDADGRLGDLRADAVARNQRHGAALAHRGVSIAASAASRPLTAGPRARR